MDLPPPRPDEVLVETWYSGISPGTELRCLAGRQRGVGEDQFPFVPGYSLVGQVVQADRANRLAVGTVVYCRGTTRSSRRLLWGGHVSHALVDVNQARPLPAGIAAADAALLRLAAISYRGVRLAGAVDQQTVAVVGLGPIGQLSARIFAAGGARVLGCDLSPERVAMAEAAGVHALRVQPGALNKTVRAEWPKGADIVVDATGNAGVLRESLQLVRDRAWDEETAPGGRLIVQGSYAGDVTLAPETAFAKELQILWPRDCQQEDLTETSRLLERGALRLADLVGVPVPIEQAPDVYRELRERPADRMTAVFSWRRADV